MPINYKRIAQASNDVLLNEDGSRHIDMFGANGTVLLGHVNESVNKHMHAQLDKLWATGLIDSPIRIQARELVDTFFPDSHGLAGFYSTGMEAAEFAIRLSRITTGRSGLVGFAKSMHGKSMATAFLAWDNPSVSEIPGFNRLPYPSPEREEEVFDKLSTLLKTEKIAVVFLEPIQGSGGGYSVSPGFALKLQRLCQETGTLLLMDEILTGFHRTGNAFAHQYLGIQPDIILIGKIMGNGFPVSGVVTRRNFKIEPRMLPGSTYAGNALAAAAVIGTLSTLRTLEIEQLSKNIESKIREAVGRIESELFTLRGRGLLWIFEFKEASLAEQFASDVYSKGVFIGHAGPLARLMPAATIEQDNLDIALGIIGSSLAQHAC